MKIIETKKYAFYEETGINDIFQEIFDDFSELQFEFEARGPGHFQMISRTIDTSMIDFNKSEIIARKQKNKSYQRKEKNDELSLVRKKSFEFANRLEPYLEEASDRLGDIGYRCTFNPSENVRLLDKMSPSFAIVINCYELPKNKIKKFESFITEPIKGPVTKEELEEIEVIMIDLIDKYDYLEFKVKVHKNSRIPGLISLQSLLIDCRDNPVANMKNIDITNFVYDIEDYLKNDGEIIDRMNDIGFKYDFTQYTHARYHVYFSRI